MPRTDFKALGCVSWVPGKGRVEPCLARNDSGLPTPGFGSVERLRRRVRRTRTDPGSPPALLLPFRTDDHGLLTGCVPILNDVNQ